MHCSIDSVSRLRYCNSRKISCPHLIGAQWVQNWSPLSFSPLILVFNLSRTKILTVKKIYSEQFRRLKALTKFLNSVAGGLLFFFCNINILWQCTNECLSKHRLCLDKTYFYMCADTVTIDIKEALYISESKIGLALESDKLFSLVHACRQFFLNVYKYKLK